MPGCDALLIHLARERHPSPDGRYCLTLLEERPHSDVDLPAELRDAVASTLGDAKEHLRSLALNTLDPVRPAAVELAAGWPEVFPIDTQKGYFGEALAGLVAETLGCCGYQHWRVPAYLFRFHSAAFLRLQAVRQTGEAIGVIPGRSGDDCLAFGRDADGAVCRCLVCEAKCLKSHRSDELADAHVKLSSAEVTPVSLWQVVEVLRSHHDDESRQWDAALTELLGQGPTEGFERCDLVAYICGDRPSPPRRSWSPADRPHSAYAGSRKLEVAEVHLCDVEDTVKRVFTRQERTE